MVTEDRQEAHSRDTDCEEEGEAYKALRDTLNKVQESLTVKRSARESVVRLVGQPHLAKRKK